MYARSTIGVPSVFGDDFFDSMLKDFNQIMKSPRFSFEDSFPPINVYAVNVEGEEGNGFFLESALTGYKKEWLSVSIEGTVLTIEAKVPEEKDSDKQYLKRRIKATSFKKSYKIPEGYDAEKADVTYEDGLLSVFIPLKEKKVNTLQLTIK